MNASARRRRFDLVFVGATLLSPAGPHRVLRDAVVGVADGRIVSIGTERPAPGEAARTLDLPGRVITPDFVNVHAHCILTMVRGVAAGRTDRRPRPELPDPRSSRETARCDPD